MSLRVVCQLRRLGERRVPTENVPVIRLNKPSKGSASCPYRRRSNPNLLAFCRRGRFEPVVLSVAVDHCRFESDLDHGLGDQIARRSRIRRPGHSKHPELRFDRVGPKMRKRFIPKREMSPNVFIRASETGQRYEALLRIGDTVAPHVGARILKQWLSRRDRRDG